MVPNSMSPNKKLPVIARFKYRNPLHNIDNYFKNRGLAYDVDGGPARLPSIIFKSFPYYILSNLFFILLRKGLYEYALSTVCVCVCLSYAMGYTNCKGSACTKFQ